MQKVENHYCNLSYMFYNEDGGTRLSRLQLKLLYQVKKIRMYFDFKTEEAEKIKIKFALSSVSQENALENMQAEIKDWDFEKVKAQDPASVQVCSLLLKPNALKAPIPDLTYVGFEIPNEFVVGYGLDYNDLGRNLKDIYRAI